MPWVGIKDATENHGRVIDDTLQHTNKLGIDNSSARILPKNTVCLSRTASVGYVVVMGKAMATSQDFVNWVCSESIDYRYLKYVLLAEQSAFLRFASGTTHQTIYFPEVKAFHVCLPPLPEQRAIAHILGVLDDKIELNRRMNETLEAMARTIFQSWFVEFDGHGDFVDSELGPIPRGWTVGPASDLLVLLSGGTPKTSVEEYWDGTIPWFSVKDAPPDGQVWVVATEKRVTEAGVLSSSTQILPERTTVVSARGTVGKLALTGLPMAMNQSCYGVRGRDGYPEFFVYYLLRTLVQDLQRRAHGSVFDTITRQTFETVAVVKPPLTRAREFHDVAAPLLKKMLVSQRQSRTLAALRDTLLPKLVSGEIRVPDAEKAVERAL